MNTRMKWFVLPAALLTVGTLAMAQSRTPAAQSSGSSAIEAQQSEGAGTYVEAKVDRTSDEDKLVATRAVNKAFFDLSRAFSNRDLDGVKQVWPSVPETSSAALAKTFGYFKSASRNFVPENIGFSGDTAAVVGNYSGSFVSKGTTIPSNGTFRATLKKSGTRWIVSTLICN